MYVCICVCARSCLNTCDTISVWRVWAWCAHSLTCCSSYFPRSTNPAHLLHLTPKCQDLQQFVSCSLLTRLFPTVSRNSTFSACLCVTWLPHFLIHTSSATYSLLESFCLRYDGSGTLLFHSRELLLCYIIEICLNNHLSALLYCVGSKASGADLHFFKQRPASHSKSYMYLLVEAFTVEKSKAFAL